MLKLMGLWQHEKEMSNQPRKAWMSVFAIINTGNFDRLLKLTVIAGSLELERHIESKIFLLHCSDVDMPNSARVGGNGSELNTVNKRFTKSDFLDTRVIKTVDVVPDC